MYTKKSKLIGAMLAVIMILQVVCTSITSVVFAVEEANEKTITFADENLYTAIKEALGDIIEESNDETNTIVITNANINRVSSLNLSGKGIKDLSGIQNFVGLTKLNLSDNEIETIDWLAGIDGTAEPEPTTAPETPPVQDGTSTQEETSDGSEVTSSLKNLTVLDLSNNHIEDCSILEDSTKFPLLNKENISIGSQNLKSIVIYDNAKGGNITHNLPQIFTYIYEENKNLNPSNITTQGNILTGLTVSNIDYDEMKIEINNVQNEGLMKVSFEFGEGFGAETTLTVYIIAVTNEERKGIKFEDVNLYNAVKDSLNEKKIIGTWYDEALTLVIDKNYLYKDITDLDLKGKQIENIEGLQYFVGLEELDLSDNSISKIDVLSKFAEEKEKAEEDLKNIISAKHAELKTYIEKKEEYNKLLSKSGRTTEISKAIEKIKTYINGLNAESNPPISDTDKENLLKWFFGNIEVSRFVSEGVGKKVDNQKLKVEPITDKEGDEEDDITQLKDGYMFILKEVKHEAEGEEPKSAYNTVQIDSNQITVKVWEWKDKEEGASKFENVGGEIKLEPTIIKRIQEGFTEIQDINNGIINGVNIDTERGYEVRNIEQKLNEIERYYDIENLLLILTKEDVELKYDNYKEVEFYTLSEASSKAVELISRFITNYDKLTSEEKTVLDSDKKSLESEKTSITNDESKKSNRNGLIKIVKDYIGKQRNILEGINYSYSGAENILYSEYITYCLKEKGDDYINAEDSDAFRKDVLNIIDRMKNVNLDEVVALPKIKKIDLSSNNLKDVEEIAKVTTLLIIDLSDNVISNIPDFTNSKKLYKLNLSHNMIYTPVIAKIDNLQELNLAYNHIKDITPSEINFKEFVKLQNLNLSGNEINDLKTIMYNLYLLSKNQKMNDVEQIIKTVEDEKTSITGGTTLPALGVSTDFSKFGYKVDVDKVDFSNQTIYASAKNKLLQSQVAKEFVYLPEIFKQVKQIESYLINVEGKEETCETTFLYAKAYNDGMILYLDTSRLGEQTNSATIEGRGIARGTICKVTYTVATQEELNEIPATGIQVQIEKTLTDDENAARPDFNNDGKVNSEDLVIFNKYWLGAMTLTEAQENLAKNIVPDNNLTKEDHLLLVKYVESGWDNNKLTDEQRQKAEEADILGDFEVTNEDFIVLSNYLIGGVYSPYTEAQIIAKFDINGDGKVTAIDSICMSRYLTSKSTERINISTLTLEMLNNYKQSKQLYAELYPENTTQKQVEWVSHDERIVRVDSTGKATAVGTGTTQITVKSTKNADIYDTISVTVKAAADIATEMRLKDKESLEKEYYVGQELDLSKAKVIVTKLSGQEEEITITKEMIKGFDTTTETGDSPRVVTVEYTDKFDVTVQTAFNITVVEFTGEDVIKEIKLVPPKKLEYNKNEELDLTGATVEKIMESGIKQEPVPVTTKMVSGYDKTKAGKQTVTVTYEGKKITFEVMVNNPVTGVNLNKSEYTIVKGGVTQLVATVIPSDAVNKNVTWKSSDEKVAKVDDAGKVTAVGIGEAIITVTTKDGVKSTTCRIIVKEQVYKVATLENKTIAITGINPNTTEKQFRDRFLSENTYKLFKKDGKTALKDGETIATGYKLKVYNAKGTVKEEQVLVVKGDTNGDGQASATDSGAILSHRTGEKKLKNEYLLAADINNDGAVDGRDSTLLIYHRIGMAGYILQNY